MSEWDLVTLAEAGIQLLDCVHKTPVAEATGLPYVAIPQLEKGEIELSDARRISVTDFEEWTKKADPQPFDMVLSRRCNPGETAFVRPGMRFALGQNLVLLRADGTRVRPTFLRWMVRSPYWWAEINKFLNVGAVFDSLRCADVPKFSLPIPPLNHQDQISLLLGALDDKIALNRQMNKTLEAMARAIFKDWFLDFGPTRAKAENHPGYLAPELWALFPDIFNDQGIPEGWRMGELQEIVVLNPKEPLTGGTVAPYLEMSALPTSGSTPEAPVDREFTSGMRFRNGDTLLARITPCLENGKTAFIQRLPANAIGWGSTEFIVIRPLPPVPKPYGYIIARDPGFRARAIQSMTGTSGRQRARTEVLAKHLVAIPNSRIWNAFSSIVDPMFDRIKVAGEETQTLAHLRDTLLPKLMSGEIRMKDVEQKIEEAL
jgi:type I restriction enzyme S subunit